MSLLYLQKCKLIDKIDTERGKQARMSNLFGRASNFFQSDHFKGDTCCGGRDHSVAVARQLATLPIILKRPFLT